MSSNNPLSPLQCRDANDYAVAKADYLNRLFALAESDDFRIESLPAPPIPPSHNNFETEAPTDSVPENSVDTESYPDSSDDPDVEPASPSDQPPLSADELHQSATKLAQQAPGELFLVSANDSDAFDTALDSLSDEDSTAETLHIIEILSSEQGDVVRAGLADYLATRHATVSDPQKVRALIRIASDHIRPPSNNNNSPC